MAYKHFSETSEDVSSWAASSAEFDLWGAQKEGRGSAEGAGPTLRSGMSKNRISDWWKKGKLIELRWGTYLSFHAVDEVDVSSEVAFENFFLYLWEPNL